MRTVSAALQAQLLKRVWKPAFTIEVDDRRNGGVATLAWDEWYDGDEVNVADTAMVVSGDWVHDARVNINTDELFIRRTDIAADPADSVWNKRAPNVRDDAQIAMAVDGDDLWAFWVDVDKRTIKYRYSDDAGLTWAVTATAVDLGAGQKCNSLAAVCPGAGLHDVILLMIDSATQKHTTQDKMIRWSYFIDGVGWSAAADWGMADGLAGRGIGACAHDGDAAHSEVTFFVAGKFVELDRGFNLTSFHLNVDDAHAATFTAAGTHWQGDAGTVSPYWPSMVEEGVYDRARVFYQLYDESLPSAKRWQGYQLYIHQLLSGEEITVGASTPFQSTDHAYTLGLGRAGDVLVGGANDSIYKADVWDGSDPWLVDVSGDVIAWEHHVFDNALIEDIAVYPGYAYVILDNHDGRYDDFGSAGNTYEAVKRGAQVWIKAGYQTPTGNELVDLPPMWIDGTLQICNARSSTSQDIPHVAIAGGGLMGGRMVVLKCYDCWALLTKRGPTYTFTSNVAPRDISANVLAQVGIGYSDDGSDRLGLGGGGYPQVTWVTQQGTAWYLMIRDMLRYVNCRVTFGPGNSDGSWPTAAAYVFEDRDVDPADLEVGGDGEQLILGGVYTESDRFGGYGLVWEVPPYSPNTSRLEGEMTGAVLEGDGVSEIEIDYDQIAKVGYWQPRHVVDFQVSADTFITAAERVVSAAADGGLPLFGGQVMIPLHPSLKVRDRIHVTDKWATQTTQKRFVVGIDSYYDTRGKRARFDQTVHLLRHVQ